MACRVGAAFALVSARGTRARQRLLDAVPSHRGDRFLAASGMDLGHWNWRVLLISEGALPFIWLVIWWAFIDDYPHQARWISTEERDDLEIYPP